MKKRLKKNYLCSICKVKRYLTIRGLTRHENATHKNYNIIRPGISQLPADHIAEFKRMLVHAIQKQLPLHFSRSGKQLVKFPYTESQFVGVFGRYITRFSPAKSSYYCIFKGENADNILSEIFEDQQWGTRFYDSGQCAYVILYIENLNQQQLSLQQKENSQTESSLKKQPIQPEMHIQWYTESLSDTKGHSTSSGYISMIFRIDRDYE
ncbi:zinc finger bed domain-containing protein ricesleeper 2-like [Gigaspora margarita]|uniref:Zinc finger bed domain-containing protein ricesleeper 2-like n=1 Tax=Gigaspora margarita TaxID=4874 RepID=A0A8H3ZYT2_GIGMA|nr:zinc finger bed domain-containing protein ricesleeper 2-like [Gigaspora margarita]